jgi:hypothetical protein
MTTTPHSPLVTIHSVAVLAGAILVVVASFAALKLYERLSAVVARLEDALDRSHVLPKGYGTPARETLSMEDRRRLSGPQRRTDS